jgi:hypothetical protein
MSGSKVMDSFQVKRYKWDKLRFISVNFYNEFKENNLLNLNSFYCFKYSDKHILFHGIHEETLNFPINIPLLSCTIS